MFKKVLLSLYVLFFCVSFAVAQEASSPDATAVVADNVSMSETGSVSFDFREADIRNVFKILSVKSGVNIVASPEITGLVTIQLNDVPWQQALDVILQTYGYAYERKGNIIMVTTVENLKKRREDAVALAEQSPLETKTFILNFARASAVIESIDKMKSDRGSVNFDERTNTLIVHDTASQIELMGQVITTLDKTTPQVLIEGKIIETTLSDEENLGINWVTQAAVSGSQRPLIWPFDDAQSSRFAPGSFPAVDDGDFTFGTLNFSQLQAVMELLKTRSDTDILSNPRIVTLDNQPASMTVGSQYPIPSYTYNEEQARLQVSGWEYKDIGIIFEVTPHVSSAGFVTLDVMPKVTAILDYVTVENTTLPRLSNEATTTKVMVKDGDTLVIAGLVKDQVTDVKRRTPILGDIPLVGLAFTKSENVVSKTDLLIFITPSIITPEIAQK